jgi:hypothetical protein
MKKDQIELRVEAATWGIQPLWRNCRTIDFCAHSCASL